jgi:hypothetical protein
MPHWRILILLKNRQPVFFGTLSISFHYALSMKKTTLALSLSLFSLLANAQSDWNFVVYGEETLHHGDVRSSYNLTDPANLANNGGIRMGAYKTVNEYWAGELTVGLTGTSGYDRLFQTRMLPVEMLFHYNLLSSSVSQIAKGTRLNASIGFGSSYAQKIRFGNVTNGSWSFEEFVSAGLTYDFKITPNSNLILGYRNSIFFSDIIDGVKAASAYPDNISRFTVGYRVDVVGQKGNESALAEAEQVALEMREQLNEANKYSELLSKKVQEQKAELERQRAALAEAETQLLERDAESPTPATPRTRPAASTASGFAVIVSSFKDEAVAKDMAAGIPGAVVIPVPQLGFFRVAGAIEATYSAANEQAKRFQAQGLETWIIQL